MKNLESEGFRFGGIVDIFDAGPCVVCPRDNIRTVRDSRRAVIVDITARELRSPMYMLGTHGADFRACMASIEFDRHGIVISGDSAKLLNAQIGSTVRIAPLRVNVTAASMPVLSRAAGEGAD
jgi:arginine N-succinyltransferase